MTSPDEPELYTVIQAMASEMNKAKSELREFKLLVREYFKAKSLSFNGKYAMATKITDANIDTYLQSKEVIGERSAEEILQSKGVQFPASRSPRDYNLTLIAMTEYASQFKPKLSTLQEWISVDERLPEGEGDVLLLTTSQAHTIGDWYQGGWRTQNDTWDERRGWEPAYKIDDITHWMELPEPE